VIITYNGTSFPEEVRPVRVRDSWREALRQRGHRAAVEYAVNFDVSSDAHSGCMVALMPTAADAERLALPDGEAADQLHCTLLFLGGDASAWPDAQREGLIESVRQCFAGAPVLSGNIFGAAHWNGDGDAPCWVWNVGGGDVDLAHGAAQEALYECGSQTAPDQHAPWAAHICAVYTGNLSPLPDLEERLGPVEFDRVRISFGDTDTDILLGDSPVTAAARVDPANGVFRRRLTPVELASKFDFAGHQRSWQDARAAALHDWGPVASDWRNQISAQLVAGTDPDQLTLTTTAGADVLYRRMLDAAGAAARAQQRAAEQQGVTVPEWSLEGDGVTAALSGLTLLRKMAQTTSRVISLSLLTSAQRKALRLLGTFSGIRLASEVDAFLQGLTDKVAKDNIGTAITAAQAYGQQLVLDVAPQATYYASEVLDDRCCQPCREIDGKAFSNLGDAEATYPGGCYESCDGGGSCRGTIDTVWGDVTASGAPEEGAVTTAEELGTRPNKGTSKDRRLKENQTASDAPCAECPGDAEHFDLRVTPVAQQSETFVWDGSASRFTDPQYQKAAAACDPGDGTVKDRCFLPHHDPDGTLNRDGLAAAAGRFSGLSGHSAAAVAKARSHLAAHYRSIGEDVPPNLETAAHTHSLAVDCPPGWKPDTASDGCVPADWQPGDSAPDCPDGMVRDPDGDGCVSAPVQAAAVQTQEPVVEPSGGPTAPWEGVLAVEGVPTGDGRQFAPDALDWRDLPLPLRWNRVDSHGGEVRTEAVNVGRIDSIERVGNQLRAKGVFDLSTPDGQTVHDKVKGKFLRGVSIDADNIQNADVELVFPDSAEMDDDDPLAALFGPPPDMVVYHGGRISGATMCDIPAFPEAFIALTDADGAMVAGGALTGEEWDFLQQAADRARTERRTTVSAIPEQPPAAWFENPGLSQVTGITVTHDGRVYGHAAQWGSCHIGQAGCVQPPREDYHAHFLTGEVVCSEGSTVSVGQITVGMGHASMNANAQAAVEHYDDTSCAVVDVAVGNDVHGIWVAGAVRPDADPAKVRALRAAGRVSGDWRRIGGKLRLVGLLAINVAGFALETRTRARVASGAPMALVAAGMIDTSDSYTEAEIDRMAMRRVMDILARQNEGE
jgi:2'-5' RNA ligase